MALTDKSGRRRRNNGDKQKAQTADESHRGVQGENKHSTSNLSRHISSTTEEKQMEITQLRDE